MSEQEIELRKFLDFLNKKAAGPGRPDVADRLAVSLQHYLNIGKEYDKMREAVLSVVTQQADAVCWMDVYVMLGKLVGITVTPEQLALLGKDKMMTNCDRFTSSLLSGCPYNADYATERIKELEGALGHQKAKVRKLEEMLVFHTGSPEGERYE